MTAGPIRRLEVGHFSSLFMELQKAGRSVISGRSIRLKAPNSRGICNTVAGRVGAGPQKGEPRGAPSGRHARWASRAVDDHCSVEDLFLFPFSIFSSYSQILANILLNI